jgi:AcrR family transcriptional regulator
MVMAERKTRRDWAAAALDAIAEGGLAAVSVEPLAARLGTTKGSFYWHYANRDALVVAALAMWEERGTAGVIAELDALPDPQDRLRRLFDLVFRDGSAGRVDLALLADADDPLVAPVLARVTRRRLDYLVRTVSSLGHSREEARHRAVLSYTSYLGLLVTQRAAGGSLFPSRRAREAYLGYLLPLTR